MGCCTRKRNLQCLIGIMLAAIVLILASCGDQTVMENTTQPAVTTTDATAESTAGQMTSTTTQTDPANSEERNIDPALAGRYVCVAVYRQGENSGADDSWYELRADGTGTEYTVFEWEFTWSLEGDTILMTDSAGVETRGTVDGDTLTVEDKLLGTKSIYSRKAAEPLPTESTVPTQAPVSTETIVQVTENPTISTGVTEEKLHAYWNRGWYGWWVVEEGFGAYRDWGNGGYWWDCCADIVMDGNGNLQLSLWDEDGSRQDPMAEVEFRLEPTQGKYGVAYSTGGHFWKKDLNHNEWCIDPDKAIYDELLVLEGYYATPNSKEDAFYYTIYLRPWGKLWDDWYADERDCLPNSYESWYLPKLHKGVVSPPNKIGS